jgi:GntR family transcriptional repressor for pyruvate dehydrogenase complex
VVSRDPDKERDSSILVPFSRVERTDVLSNRVAGTLLERVLLGDLRPGEDLPSERDLSDQFGVSRTVVREAIRSLTGKGVIEARNGRKARIGLVGREQVVESMQLFLRGRRSGRGAMPYSKVHEVRRMLELTVVELAAVRRSDHELSLLRRAYEEMCRRKEDVPSLTVLDVEFHRLVAEMSGNELFVVMLDSISGVLTEIRERTLGMPGRPDSAVRYHGSILEAIAARDPVAARAAMDEHLVDSAHVWAQDDV